MKRCEWEGEVILVVNAAMRVRLGWLFEGPGRRLAEDKTEANDIASVYIIPCHIVFFLEQVAHRQACTHIKNVRKRKSEEDIAFINQLCRLLNIVSIRLRMLRPVDKVVELRLQSRTVQIRASHTDKCAGEAAMSRVSAAFIAEQRCITHRTNLLQLPVSHSVREL